MGDFGKLAPAFITLLALGGQIGLPILFLTTLRCKKLNRPSTFVNFCLTGIIYSIVFCLLIYSGNHRFGRPNDALCVAQASMVLGVLPMVSVSAFAVVLQIWATFQDPGSAIFTTFERRSVQFMLLLSPYITFLGFLLAAILVATTVPGSVGNHNGLYCFFSTVAIAMYLAPITCAALMAITAILAAVTVFQWYRRWRVMKKAFPLAANETHAVICFRAFLFNVYIWIILFVTLYYQSGKNIGLLYLAEAGLPLVVFLVFGTQKDILEAWGIRIRCQ